MLCLPMCVCCIQEEDEVPDDETVNQMIARSEEEFEQFMVNVCAFKTISILYLSPGWQM